jgi:O-antigen ligase
MTSKGLRKDSVGLMSLTDSELSYIERGCADARNINSNSLSIRMREIFWEYQNYRISGNASGFSLMLRLEYWKASLALIREEPLLGVGTGDMNLAFQSYYVETRSVLSQEWRNRSHNQFLSIAVGFGLIGLMVFLFALFYPPWKSGKLKPGLFFFFLLILLLSMMTEDTIETQAGVTFAAFFYCVLLFIPEEKSYL